MSVISIDASVASLSDNFWLSDGLRGMLFLLLMVALIWGVFILAIDRSDSGGGFHPVLGVLIAVVIFLGGMYMLANKNDPMAQLSLLERQVIALEEQLSFSDAEVYSQQYTQYFTAIDTDGSEICGQLVALPGPMVGGDDRFQVVPGLCS